MDDAPYIPEPCAMWQGPEWDDITGRAKRELLALAAAAGFCLGLSLTLIVWALAP